MSLDDSCNILTNASEETIMERFIYQFVKKNSLIRQQFRYN